MLKDDQFQGLTPALFWEHKDELLSVNQDETSNLIDRIVLEAKAITCTTGGEWTNPPTGVKPVDNKISLCCLADIPTRILEGKGHPPFPCIVLRTGNSQNPSDSTQTITDFFLIYIPTDKKAAERAFRSILLPCLDFAKRYLQNGRQVCVACETGKDLSVGLAVAILQVFFDDDGKLETERRSLNSFIGKFC